MYFKEGTVTEKHNEKHLTQEDRDQENLTWSSIKPAETKRVFVINVHYHTSHHYLHILEYGLQVNH